MNQSTRDHYFLKPLWINKTNKLTVFYILVFILIHNLKTTILLNNEYSHIWRFSSNIMWSCSSKCYFTVGNAKIMVWHPKMKSTLWLNHWIRRITKSQPQWIYLAVFQTEESIITYNMNHDMEFKWANNIEMRKRKVECHSLVFNINLNI